MDEKSKKIDKNTIVNKNLKIDRLLVENFEALEKQLKNLGVDTKPKFNIEPPISSKKLCFYNF